MRSLREKVVVITGAGSGIGRALALEAAKQGAFLALADWDESGVRETERLARAPRSFAKKVDVRSEAEVGEFAEGVARDLGGAHVVMNNAGVTVSDFVGTMKRSDFEWLMDINFWGVVRGTEAFLPQLKARDDAHIVNISSVFGLIGVPSQSAYNASKFAVRGYTEALRQELDGTSVRVTCVHPGGVKTNIVKNGRNRTSTSGVAVDCDRMAQDFEKIARTTPEQAAKIIWQGVLANAPRVLVGGDAHMIDLVQRLFPTGYASIFRVFQRIYEKSTGTAM
jgi:NAD(P)-dependent dehydrogenase (short-subunit alcohol dehydrogenase family)